MFATDTVESFPAMLRRVLRLKPDVASFPDMFAADGVYPSAEHHGYASGGCGSQRFWL
ncbi:hypothetical protein HN018_22320 (plasmid) [Lichenicola cladoniae]|uniref:Uncharacterized protein n=1 Tax=Lichenicola cladoniae TaxID=1484109 RepID=A0A6M8HWN5_9PROT|nr:hypothetical protein [Lichenicola cladoniae]QKE92953.1 hypothetical protein HN018_22320 [Lichenicola cladoniae]